MLKNVIILALSYALVNLWIAWWFWRALRGARVIRLAAPLLIMVLALAFPLLYGASGASFLQVWVFRLSSLWLGLFFYAFLIALAFDAYSLSRRILSISARPYPHYGRCVIMVLALFIIGILSRMNALWPVVVEYDLEIESASVPAAYAEKPLVLAAVSDTHLGRNISSGLIEYVVQLLAPYGPDAVVFLGDFVDDHVVFDAERNRKALSALSPRLGVWGILGNHEYIAGDVDESVRLIGESGVRLLRDEFLILDGAAILVGRDDVSSSRFGHADRKNLKDILKDLPPQGSALPLIVLDHQPLHPKEASAAGAALQLSGHTHNGQLWPFNFVVKSAFDKIHGLHEEGGTQYIISAGAGEWGPPLRNTSRPEVLVIRLHFVQKK